MTETGRITEPKYVGTKTDFYVASPAIADVVNVAIDLKRPILVEGEPGCGKTKLADSIAAEKNLGDVVKISVKSTSRAQDLLYRMNALRRLQDAQNVNNPNAQFVHPYLSLGPLGDVIHKRLRRVVLIDEIDKADIDFPNDLLDVLDTFSFTIDDLPMEEEPACIEQRGFGRTIYGDRNRPPIVVITSNREKRLPEPFLRRCLYVRVKFPDRGEELRDIVRKNTRLTAPQLSDDVLAAAVESFTTVRRLAIGNTQKPPTTSELIDWVQILHWNGISAETLQTNPYRPPHWTTLFKTMGDLDAYEALSKAAGESAV
jgi:MoxR-like ATPase